MMRPIIGVPCFIATRAGTGRAIYGCNRAYVRAIMRAGGTPVLLPPVEEADGLATVIQSLEPGLDGLLLTGGGDVDPAFYNETPLPECEPPEHERDVTELALIDWALATRMPMLAVCRGMQILNVARGGSLYQDLPTQHPNGLNHDQSAHERTYLAHDISVQPGSQLASILGSERVMVNSFHHQAINHVGEGLTVTATAEDGIVEGMEMVEMPFVVAVQYHPEELEIHDEASRKLFSAFVQACTERKQEQLSYVVSVTNSYK